MTFAVPWALWGLLLLAGPVLVHLLSRRTATRRLFPTLRFLESARLQPVSRRWLDDRALLLLRLVIITIAVLASARPQRSASAPVAGTASATTLALLVDTSASMQRMSRGGTTAAAEARRLADSAAVGVARVLRVESVNPAAAVHAAAAWLHAAGGGRLVLFSDAQRGALIRSDVAAVPNTVRFELRAIALQDANTLALQPDAVSDLDLALDVHPVQQLRDSSSPLFAADRAVVHAILALAVADLAEHPLLHEVLARHAVTNTRREPDRVPGWITIPSAPDAGAAVVGWIRPSRPVALQFAIDESHPAAVALVAITRERLRDAATVPLSERDPTVLDSGQRAALERQSYAGASTVSAPSVLPATDTNLLARGLWVAALIVLGGEWRLRTRLGRVVAND